MRYREFKATDKQGHHQAQLDFPSVNKQTYREMANCIMCLQKRCILFVIQKLNQRKTSQLETVLTNLIGF